MSVAKRRYPGVVAFLHPAGVLAVPDAARAYVSGLGRCTIPADATRLLPDPLEMVLVLRDWLALA